MNALTHLEHNAMRALQMTGLENARSGPFALNKPFTPNYYMSAHELPYLHGYQLRLVGTMVVLEEVPVDPAYEVVDAAVKHAVKTLMANMREQAQRWAVTKLEINR